MEVDSDPVVASVQGPLVAKRAGAEDLLPIDVVATVVPSRDLPVFHPFVLEVTYLVEDVSLAEVVVVEEGAHLCIHSSCPDP